MTADVWLTLEDGTICEIGGVDYHPRYDRVFSCRPGIRCRELPAGLVARFDEWGTFYEWGTFPADLTVAVADKVVFRGRVVLQELWTDSWPIPAGIDMESTGPCAIAEAHKTLGPWTVPDDLEDQV